MGHGLRHPADVDAWRRWHESRHAVRHVVRTARARTRPGSPTRVDILSPEGGADVLVVVEATHASFAGAVVAPLAHLPAQRTAIVTPVGWAPPPAYTRHRRSTVDPAQIHGEVDPSVVLATGHHTEVGSAVFALATASGSPFFVSQHGALTPFAPPLPAGARLLTWSEADGDYWARGRPDIEVVPTGSQLLWEAAGRTPTPRPPGVPLTYLGQGHAAEISRGRLAHAALTTCRRHGAVYRPHPSERDITSRAVLAAYERAGITVDRSASPLVDAAGPVVSVFSTGVLEAAARGREAWVDFPRPPTWLGEFWERYGMHSLGSDPTPAPPLPPREPSRRVAEIVLDAVS